MRPRAVRTAFIGLLLLRIAACCYAWDRLPLLPTYDEAIINDPAVALSRGFGLVAFSYSGLPIAERYAHFPPLFMFLQAATFRLFGFSALTLRFWPIAFEIIGNILLLFVLERLWRRGLIAGWAAAIASGLCLLDLPTLWNSRTGRMDTMVVSLGLTALALLLAEEKTKPIEHLKARWWAAAFLIGLAMSTHPAAIFYYWAFAAALWIFREPLGKVTAAGCLLLPGATLATIWLCTHGAQSWNAFQQFRAIHDQHQDLGMKFGYWWGSLVGGDLTNILNWGITWALVAIGWIAPAVAWLISKDRKYGVYALTGAGLYLVAWLFTGLFVPRVVLAFPLALLLLAVALSCLEKPGKQTAAVVLTLVLLVEAIAMGGYLSRSRWNDPGRSPDRFESLHFPPSATIASVPALWFQFMRTGRNFRVIYTGLPMDVAWWDRKPSKLLQYDIIILESDHPFLNIPAIRNRRITKIHDAGWEYWICAK